MCLGQKMRGLIYKDWPVVFIAEGDETHCVGDILAMIAAQDERTARKAAKLDQGRVTKSLSRCSRPRKRWLPDAPLCIPPKANKLCQTGKSRAAISTKRGRKPRTGQRQGHDAAY